MRYGRMIYTWDDVSKRTDVASACKLWYSFVLFRALEDDRVSSFDEKISKWEPGLNEINERLNYRDRDIT